MYTIERRPPPIEHGVGGVSCFFFSLKYLLTHSSSNNTVCTDVIIAHYIIYIWHVYMAYMAYICGMSCTLSMRRGAVTPLLVREVSRRSCFYCVVRSHSAYKRTKRSAYKRTKRSAVALHKALSQVCGLEHAQFNICTTYTIAHVSMAHTHAFTQ